MDSQFRENSCNSWEFKKANYHTLSKFITLIINHFCSMLCRKASDSWVCAANAHTINYLQTPT